MKISDYTKTYIAILVAGLTMLIGYFLAYKLYIYIKKSTYN